MLKILSSGSNDHPGRKYTMQLLEHFDHEGPDGNHRCLVLELLGPNVSSEAESYTSNRLPGQIAWEVARQTTQALEYIYAMGIAHGGQFSRFATFIRSTLSV
jgi:serine/threonine-protein kinase SRPK3